MLPPGGTTKLDIKAFLTDAADKLKKGKKDKKAKKPPDSFS